jgi:FixJ family two-component response regulator
MLRSPLSGHPLADEVEKMNQETMEIPMRSHIHVIDSDLHRRARVSHELLRLDLHAEIYENIDEFRSQVPKSGLIFAADSAIGDGPIEIIELLEAKGRRLPIAMYSEAPSPERIVKAMLDGALDYLQWPFDPALLDRAIERLAIEGERRAQRYVRRAKAKALIDELSPREMDVLSSLVNGNANKETAQELGISPRTVEIHRGNMMRKLNARSPSDAVRLALYAGLDEASEAGPEAIAA